MATFQEFFDLYFGVNAISGTKETAMVAWNAAIHEAIDAMRIMQDGYVQSAKYEYAAVVRNVIDSVRKLTVKQSEK